ncbi:MAG: hypothetical protein KKI08_22360 [Armatimonadetes bacterium]|nr:hypothetical protein [Armatimonadota bacterium]
MVEDVLPQPDDVYDRERQREVLGKVARELAKRRLTAPAIFTLESMMPLTYVASQALVMLKPFVQALIGGKDYAVFAAALEARENVEWLVQQLEAAENRGSVPAESEANEGG